MATELGKAYIQIMPSARGIGSSISKELNGEMDGAGRSAGSMLVGAIKGAVVAAGIGKLIGSALSQGGELQQSLGGIETLFKDSADRVKKYAAESYKTTGLSANEYMKNVTGFSASLLQSLGGDTKKAADISNMAMTDMADNSNKMGTSMDLIQNAYQGFAKQNYTMLDNLKLGYGGTKQEMERLLADAEKITGVKYDISNLSDVYQAIHAIQGKLEITGTTAKEASSTLEGSFNSMKASFQDVLGNMAIGADMTPSLNALAQTVSTFLFQNFIPMVGNVLKALPGAIVTFIQASIPIIATEAPKLINSMIEGMKSAFDFGMVGFSANFQEAINIFLTSILPKWLQVGSDMVNKMIEGAKVYIPQLLSTGVEIITSVLDGILSAIPQIFTTAGDIGVTLIQAFFSIMPEFLKKGAELILNIIDGIISEGPNIIKSILNTLVKLILTITEKLPEFLKKGMEIIINLAKGIVERLPDIMLAIGKILLYILEALVKVLPKILLAGIEIIKTLASGILQMLGIAVSAIGKILQGILLAIANTMGTILSKGVELIVNLAKGIVNAAGNVGNAVGNVLKNGMNVVSGWFRAFGDAGANIVKSIADGIWNAIGYVTDAIGNVAQAIRDFLPFSPAKEGPLRDLNKLNFGGTIADSIHGGRKIVNNAISSLTDDVNEGLSLNSELVFNTDKYSDLNDLLHLDISKIDGLSINDKEDSSVIDKLDELISVLLAKNNQQLILDSGVLVGEIIDGVDNGLGLLKRRKERGE